MTGTMVAMMVAMMVVATMVTTMVVATMVTTMVVAMMVTTMVVAMMVATMVMTMVTTMVTTMVAGDVVGSRGRTKVVAGEEVGRAWAGGMAPPIPPHVHAILTKDRADGLVARVGGLVEPAGAVARDGHELELFRGKGAHVPHGKEEHLEGRERERGGGRGEGVCEGCQ